MPDTVTSPISEEAGAWPDYAPSVAFDIKLGKNHIVNADPVLITEALRELDTPDEDIQQSTIVVHKGTGRIFGGNYVEETQTINIKSGCPIKGLLHEGQHLADASLDGLEPSSISARRRRIGVALGIATVGISEVFASKLGANLNIFSEVSLLVSGGSFGWHIGYRLAPHELKAYKTMQKPELLTKYEDMIKIDKRQ